MRRSRAIPALFCALALFGCAQDPASSISQQTDEQTQPLSQHESQEPFPAISAELTDAFIVRENSSKEYLVINTEIENHSSQDVELHTGGIVENGVLTVSSDNNLLCSWGNTYLFSDSLEPANPDYIEPIGYTIPANMSSTTAQFVYTLFDEQNGYYGNSTQPISFVLKTPMATPSDDVSEEGSTQGQEIDSSQYETLIDETFSYADLPVHSANGPYAIDNPRVRGGATLKNGAAPAVLATIICNNGTSSSVNFSQALRIEATQGGNELSILDAASFVEQVASYDPGNSSVDGDFESYAYIDGRDIEIPYIDAPGHEVDPGDSYAYPFAVLPENEEEDILVSVFLADNDSYPIYTMTIEPRDWL